MGCYYIYKGGENISLPTSEQELLQSKNGEFIYGTTVDAVERQLIGDARTEAYRLYEEDPDLIFYDSTVSAKEETILRIKKAVNDSAPLFNSGQYDVRVSDLLDEIEDSHRKNEHQSWEDRNKNEALKFLLDFYPEFGTAFHEANALYDRNAVKQSPAYEAAKDAVLKVIKDFKDKYGSNSFPPNSPFHDQSFKNNAKIILDPDFDAISNSIDEICAIIHNAAELNQNDGSTFFEQTLVYKSPKGISIKGTIDCIKVLEDGSVIIYDFKSSVRHGKGLLKALRHYGQLFMYKEMLASFGIPKEKISIQNVNITYDEKGFKTDGTNPFYIFAPSTKQNPGELMAKVAAKFRPHFPLLKQNLTSQEERIITDKIQTVQKEIFSEKSLNKDESENLTEYLKKIDPNKPFFSAFLDEAVLIETEGDSIIWSSLKNKGQKKVMSLEKFVNEEINSRQNKKEERFNQVQEALKKKNLDAVKMLMSEYKGRNLNLANQLGQYMGSNWEVISHPVFNSLHILVLLNNATNTYDFINFAPNVYLDKPYTMHHDDSKTMHILGNMFSPEDLAKYKNGNMHATAGDIRILQTMIAIAFGQNDLSVGNQGMRVGQIKVISEVTGFGTFNLDYDEHVKQLAIIDDMCKNSPQKSKNRELHAQTFEGIKKITWAPYEETLADRLTGLLFEAPVDESYLTNVKDALSISSLSAKIDKLIEIQSSFRQQHASELNLQDKTNRQYVSDVQKIDQLLSALIQKFQGLLTDEAFEVSQMGLDYDNSVRAGWSLIKNGDVGKFSANGILLSGFLQGLSSATPYANPDDTVRMLSTLHTFGTTQIQMEAEDYISDQNEATSKWLEAKESHLKTMLVGNHRNLYKQLMKKKSGTNELDPAFRFKNPFEESMPSEDKEYLCVTIWNLLRIKDNFNLPGVDESVKKQPWKEFSKNSEYVKALKKYIKDDPNTLNIPLRSASEMRQGLNFLKSVVKFDWKKSKEYWTRKLEKSRNWWDPSGLSDKQLNEKEEKIKALRAYNMYTESLSDRRQRLQANGIDAFEVNINYLVNDFIYSQISVNVNQKILDTTDRMVASLKYVEMLTGRDLSDQIEEIKKRTRISMYNTNTVEKGYQDLNSFLNHLRSVMNFGVIAARPVLMAKELTVGRLKNYMHTAFGYFHNDEITMKAMAQAETIVFGEGVFGDKVKKVSGKMKPGDRSKVEALNWLYRVANMDSNVLTEKTLADRYGIMNMGGDIAYYTNTRPDWYNRMAIFVAKMIADGSWEAHTLDPKTNKLKYDMSKDKRYAMYAKYRKNPPKKGEAHFDEYQKQYAQYLWALQSFEKAGIKNENGQPLKEGDDLPIAYTVEETNSIKETTGMLYGYYNHEERTSFQTGTYSQLFMAFKTYIVGELKYYFALPNSKTSVGKVGHITDGIPTKEHPNGSPLYIQKDSITGLEIYTTEAFDKNGNANRPHYGWVANQSEGLFTSFLICLGDLFTSEGRKDLATNKERRQRMELFLIRAIIFALLASLFASLKKNADENNKAAITAFQVFEKAAKDMSFKHSIYDSIDDFGLVGLDYLDQLANGALTTLTDGDKQLQSFILKNVHFAKDMKHFIETEVK